jgi:hypothetical protein
LPNHALITFGGAEQKVTELFPYLRTMRVDRLLTAPTDRWVAMLGSGSTDGSRGDQEEANCQFFHIATMIHGICSRMSYLQGYRNLSIMSYYDAMFECPPDLGAAVFEETLAPESGTVVISPYSTGNAKYSPPVQWWEQLVEKLNNGEEVYGVRGSIIKTNGETPIRGTSPLYLPYKSLVPYLDKCRGFIGARSGLCEIVSSAKCRKVVIYSRQSEWYPEGMMMAYTGLGSIGEFTEVYF